jgi:hypothetical protein
MKSSIVITLIVAGTLLILSPPLFNQAHQRNVLRALTEKRTAEHIHAPPPLSPKYELGCWLMGALAMGAAIVSSVRSARTVREPETSAP